MAKALTVYELDSMVRQNAPGFGVCNLSEVNGMREALSATAMRASRLSADAFHLSTALANVKAIAEEYRKAGRYEDADALRAALAPAASVLTPALKAGDA
jgi:hypothetical protein